MHYIHCWHSYLELYSLYNLNRIWNIEGSLLDVIKDLDSQIGKATKIDKSGIIKSQTESFSMFVWEVRGSWLIVNLFTENRYLLAIAWYKFLSTWSFTNWTYLLFFFCCYMMFACAPMILFSRLSVFTSKFLFNCHSLLLFSLVLIISTAKCLLLKCMCQFSSFVFYLLVSEWHISCLQSILLYA